MPSTIAFSYRGVSVTYDPADDLADVLDAARRVAAAIAAPETTAAPGRNPAPPAPPRDAGEARERFYARYAPALGAATWDAVQRYLGRIVREPVTVDGWIKIAEEVRDLARRAA